MNATTTETSPYSGPRSSRDRSRGHCTKLIAAVAFVIVAIGAWTGWRWRYGLRAMARDDGPMSPDRNYFLATLTIAFNALIGVLILASAIPQVFLSPCE